MSYQAPTKTSSLFLFFSFWWTFRRVFSQRLFQIRLDPDAEMVPENQLIAAEEDNFRCQRPEVFVPACWKHIPRLVFFVFKEQQKQPRKMWPILMGCGGFKCFLFSSRSLGKWSNLTSIFFTLVGSTTNLWWGWCKAMRLNPERRLIDLQQLFPRRNMLVNQSWICQCRAHAKREWTKVYMGVSLNGGTPKSSILIGFSIINHPFWGTTIFGNTHIASDLCCDAFQTVLWGLQKRSLHWVSLISFRFHVLWVSPVEAIGCSIQTSISLQGNPNKIFTSHKPQPSWPNHATVLMLTSVLSLDGTLMVFLVLVDFSSRLTKRIWWTLFSGLRSARSRRKVPISRFVKGHFCRDNQVTQEGNENT